MVIPCDIRKKYPISPVWSQPFDILSMHSVAEVAARNKSEMQSYMHTIASLIKPNGWFIGMFVKHCKQWKVGKNWHTCMNIDEHDIIQLLTRIHINPLSLHTIPPEKKQGYEGLICVFGQRKNEY